MKKGIKIAVSGRSGCGNTTVSRVIADILGLHFVNFTFRSLAQERAIDFKTILELASSDDSWDIEVDTRQVALAREEGGCVLGSRLAIWMLKEADLKVYLEANPQTRADRIVKREGGNPEEVALFTAERDKKDHDRYLRIYNIDTNDYSFADMIIETDKLSVQQISDMVIEKAKNVR
ncbi:MAG: cytidylate kinase family protein [Treponema sp.]|nr:cytidylate kinase family protein [Treponema sp.]